MKIRAITFDFWGTLYDSASSETASRARRRAELVRSLFEPYVTLPLDRVEEILHDASRLRAVSLKGFTVAERLGWVARELGLSPPEETLGAVASEVSSLARDLPPRPFESAKAVLDGLSGEFELGLVSDTGLTDGAVLREIMWRDGLAPPVRAFSFSDETGVSKPHADAFLAALGELGVRPAEAVHVGDVVATDVAGACRLGMKAVWIGGDLVGGLPEGLAAVAVRGLAEVPGAIRSML